MRERDDFQTVFSEELSALDAFFDRRAEEHAHFKMGRQDPDVRRILEAIAFFSARTRQLAQANVRDAIERLVRGQLDELLSPVPAAGMLLAHVENKLGAVATLPEGTEVRLNAPDRSVGVFSTRRPLDLLPLKLQSVGAPVGADRLDMQLDAWVGLRGALPPLRFLIDSRGNYRDSLRLLSAMRTHLRAVRVAFDEDNLEAATEVEWSLGAPPASPEGDGRHPFDKIRSFFHFPQQDLFFTVQLPSQRRPWRRVFLYLELERNAPRELLRAGRQAFLLFAVPIDNTRRSHASPIVCDGTKDSYPIRDGRPDNSSVGKESPSALVSIEGVYRVTERGNEPLVPGILSDAGACFDPVLVRPHEGIRGEPHIALRIPGAFEKPVKVMVDAEWYQPSFEASAAGLLEASLTRRNVEGMRLEMAGDLALSRKSPLVHDAPGLLHIMALRTKTVLTRDELVCLLACLGADRSSPYRRLPELLKDVRVEEAPGNEGQGKKYIYTLDYRRDDPDFEGIVRDGMLHVFEDQIEALLEAWIADEVELVRHQQVPRVESRQPMLRMIAGGAA